MINIEIFIVKNDCLKSFFGYGNFLIYDRVKDD